MVDELDLVSHSTLATLELGRLIGGLAKPDSVIALDGEMGTGKTTFVRGLAAGLGIDQGISSPTYTLMHTYAGRLQLFHFDAWMQGREEAFLDGGGDEWFHAGGVSVVEWASRVADFLPADRLELELIHPSAPSFDTDGQLESDQQRGVRLVARGPKAKALLETLRPSLSRADFFGKPA